MNDGNTRKSATDSIIRRTFAYLQQSVSLLKHKRYCLFLTVFLLYGTGLSAFYTHVGNAALTRGLSKDQAAILSSIIGIAGIVAKIPTVIYTHVLDLNTAGLYVVHLLGVGFVIGAFSLVTNFPLMVTCCALYGLFLSVVSSLLPEMVIKIIGLKNVSIGVSYSSLLQGIGAMIGGPLGAWAFELDPTYRSTFLLTGGVFLISGLLVIPSWLTCNRRSDDDEAQVT